MVIKMNLTKILVIKQIQVFKKIYNLHKPLDIILAENYFLPIIYQRLKQKSEIFYYIKYIFLTSL